ncbi:hypothetical protein LA080_004319 [Diaporthe eres]|nr:hypothetical protein LA080_004319 [Diaporthe eres]
MVSHASQEQGLAQPGLPIPAAGLSTKHCACTMMAAKVPDDCRHERLPRNSRDMVIGGEAKQEEVKILQGETPPSVIATSNCTILATLCCQQDPSLALEVQVYYDEILGKDRQLNTKT